MQKAIYLTALASKGRVIFFEINAAGDPVGPQVNIPPTLARQFGIELIEAAAQARTQRESAQAKPALGGAS